MTLKFGHVLCLISITNNSQFIIGAVLMANNCPPIFPEITTQEQQIEYISTIVQCEQDKSDLALIEYFAKGMTNYLLSRIQD
jgi:hypothetical protein